MSFIRSASLTLAALIVLSANSPAQQNTDPAASAEAQHVTSQMEVEVPPAGATRTLPPGVEPNPPKPEELALNGMTWKGEYETDTTGKILLGSDAMPLPVLYNKKGKRVRSKVKLPKTHPISISNGTLTVDGWAGKAQMNYDVPDMQFLYLSSPSIGTVVISQVPFPGSKEQKAAFDGQTLTVKVEDHELQLASDKPMLKTKAASAYVKYDAGFTQDGRYPVMGYGSAIDRPYAWPGAKEARVSGAAGDAPPLPASMKPKLATTICIPQAGHSCATPAAASANAAPQSSTAPQGMKETAR